MRFEIGHDATQTLAEIGIHAVRKPPGIDVDVDVDVRAEGRVARQGRVWAVTRLADVECEL